jgi:hypothetical protein
MEDCSIVKKKILAFNIDSMCDNKTTKSDRIIAGICQLCEEIRRLNK